VAAGIAKEGFVKLNAGQHVPCRVAYDAATFERLKLAIRMGGLETKDRVGLVSDLFALARAGKKDVGDVLELLAEMANDLSYTLWAEIESDLKSLAPVLEAGYKNYSAFAEYIKALLRAPSEKVGWEPKEDDDHLTKMLRGVLIRLQSDYPNEEAIKEATTRFWAFHGDPESKALPSDYRAAVYKIVLKTGGEREYNALYSIFKRAKTHPEKLEVMRCLGQSQHQQLKQRTLQWALHSEDIKLQDIMYPVMGVATSGAEGIELCWQWFQENFTALEKKAGNAMGIMNHLVSICGGRFVTKEKAKEVEDFFEAHPVPLATRKISQMLENMRINSDYLERMQGGKLGDDGFFVLIMMTLEM